MEAQRNIISWHQDNIFVACMGLRKEAEQLNYAKMKNASNRFPTFYGPGMTGFRITTGEDLG